MNDQITLDHPSCHPVTGWFRATGEWEASPDVTIYLTATGRGNGIGIDWDYEVTSVDLAETATAYNDTDLRLIMGTRWLGAFCENLPHASSLWMLGVAYCWAMKSAADWADKHAEPIAE